MSAMLIKRIVLSAILSTTARGKCFEPNPAFPVPTWTNGAKELGPAFEALELKLKMIATNEKYDNSSYSIEITSKIDTLWSSFHSAKNHNESRSGDTVVGSSSQYRIASCTKVFTVLAILYQVKAGKLSLDDPVAEYIADFSSPDYELPWKDITLGALASQLSGIPREFAQSDLYNQLPDPQAHGFPYVPKKEIPVTCDEYDNYARACNRSDLFQQLKSFQPLFAPNQKSTYSNLNYELLGLVIENVTGMAYKDYIQTSIFDPLNMTLSTVDKPASDEHAVLPLGFNYWDVDEGVQNPTGGIYSSSSDLSKFLRYVLTHYNSLAKGVNWLLPRSWSEGTNSYYGMPWEIFRTDKILVDSQRPITFVGKSGGLPGYYSRITILEDYGLAVTILVGGNPVLLDELLEAVTVALVRAAEEAVWEDIYHRYHGLYLATTSSLNSSLTLEISQRKGLHLTSVISNGTDMLALLIPNLSADDIDINVDPRPSQHAQLVPTLLFEDEENQKGEIWRAVIVADRPASEDAGIWDDFCATDIDTLTYATVPVNKIVFWHDEGEIELPAFRVRLSRMKEENGDESVQFVVQG